MNICRRKTLTGVRCQIQSNTPAVSTFTGEADILVMDLEWFGKIFQVNLSCGSFASVPSKPSWDRGTAECQLCHIGHNNRCLERIGAKLRYIMYYPLVQCIIEGKHLR